MNQPPLPTSRPPDWRRPPGVAAGTWDYVHQGSIADRYDDFVADVAMADVERKVLSECFPVLEKVGSQSIIDLGCGTGRTAIPLSRRGYDVLAVDLSQPMLVQLASKIKAMSADGSNPSSGQAGDRVPENGTICPLRANLVQLDALTDDRVDHAVCLFSTLGMIAGREHRRQMLRHVHRTVRPGGTFLLHVHHRWAALREPGGMAGTIVSLAKSWRESKHEFGDSTYAYRGLERMFMHRFSRRELMADLLATRWQVKRCLRLSIDGKRLTGRLPICGGFFIIAQA